MPKIRILPDRVANQIAAGEVIERPAAVVKELVENALDAGATRIEVEFRHGGRSLLRVEDNGCGMMRDDALLALERHATSKIETAEDLNRLASFGFRGEALPSIASVSRFLLQTRERTAELGTEVLVNGGKLVHVRECGRPVGTRIEVAQLFHPVPARRKFLKTDQTEAAHIVHCVRLYALASPRVAFTLIEDGRMLFRSPECTTLRDRVAEIFGRQIAEEVMPIEAVENGFALTGLIGRPGGGRPTRHEMITFVNGRPVDSRTLNYALLESYHESLPKGRYPLAFVFFQLDPAAVDVNVHPAKREVRFREEGLVRGFIIRSVLQCLRDFSRAAVAPQAAASAAATAVAPEGERGRPAPATMPVGGPPLSPPPPSWPGTSWSRPMGGAPIGAPCSAAPRPEPPAPTPDPADSGAANATTVGSPAAAPHASAAVGTPAAGDAVAAAASPPPVPWRWLGLAQGNLAVFASREGIVLLDRRAAWERVWYERLQAEFAAGKTASQRLLLPIPVELDAIGSALLLDRLDFFLAHGFEIGEFGRHFFRIEAVPEWMVPADAEPFLRALVGALREGRLPERDLTTARSELALLAIGRGLRLPASPNEAQMHHLLAELFATRQPLTSPSGRPTYIEIGPAELARRFQK